MLPYRLSPYLSLDGGQEVISARFIRPEEAMSEFKARKITFMPPQFYILHTLASILKGAKNTLEERTTIQTLSSGHFGGQVINPRRLEGGAPGLEKGEAILTYEGDETRGGSPGRLHRAVISNEKKGVSLDLRIPQSWSSFNLSIGSRHDRFTEKF